MENFSCNRCVVVLLLIGQLVCLPLFSSTLAAATPANDTVEQDYATVRAILAEYNERYPQIQFAHLRNHQEWYKSLQALELLIGYQATSLDYEHPEDLRQDLLFATVNKIRLMLENSMVSSSLFRTGQMPFANKQHVCIITLEPEVVMANSRMATEYFIDLSLDNLPDARLLDRDKHLRFVIDHEAYHCLDTLYFGGFPMSNELLSTHYEIHRREIEADMFAIARQLQRYRDSSEYAEKIMHLRGMSLLNGELQHVSADAMQVVLDHDRRTVLKARNEKLVQLIKRLHQPLAKDYDGYLQYRANAIEAMHRLGRQLKDIDCPALPADLASQEDRVTSLVNKTRLHYEAFFGRPMP